MARCFGCHLERSLGPVPVQGQTAALPEVLCGRCSKAVDFGLGILDGLGFDISFKAAAAEAAEAPQANRKGRGST